MGPLREELRTEKTPHRQLCLQALSVERSRRRLLQEVARADGGGIADALQLEEFMGQPRTSAFAKMEPGEPDSLEFQPFGLQRSQLQTMLLVADASLLM